MVVSDPTMCFLTSYTSTHTISIFSPKPLPTFLTCIRSAERKIVLERKFAATQYQTRNFEVTSQKRYLLSLPEEQWNI